MTTCGGDPPLYFTLHAAPVNKEPFMTLNLSRFPSNAAKRLTLSSLALCLLLLTACAPQQSALQHHQYSIVRYQDSLTDLHEYRPPARETLSYTARREFQTASATVSRNNANARFAPVPDEEFDDGDIEVTPELLKDPSLYPTISLIRPIKDTIRVTSSFGPRKHPIKRRRLMHAGVDIAGTRGEKVVASAPGKIVYSGRNGSYGLTIDIDAGKGVILRYAHLDKLGVREGQKVKQGQYIGNLGRTGRVTAPHLHFEVRLRDKPINPMQFISPEHQWASNTGAKQRKRSSNL